MIEWLRTPQNEIWGRFQGRALCSSRSPRKEAAQWADALGLREDTREIAVVGIGAGYHLLELLNRFPSKSFVALDSKETLLESWPQELCKELGLHLDRIRLITGENAVRSFVNSANNIPVVRFRAACTEFDDQIFEELLAQSPEIFSNRSRAKGYDFAKALRDIPKSLAVNVKSLNVENLTPDSHEAKLLRTLKELVR